jgi:hypothetical protein
MMAPVSIVLGVGVPQDIQQNLSEAAVTAKGEMIRQQLAVSLHGKHERTVMPCRRERCLRA